MHAPSSLNLDVHIQSSSPPVLQSSVQPTCKHPDPTNQPTHTKPTQNRTNPNPKPNRSADASTRLSYTWGWRSLMAGPAASRSVRAQRGDFLSDALRWTWVVDERDSPTLHTEVGGRGTLGRRVGLAVGEVVGFQVDAELRAALAFSLPSLSLFLYHPTTILYQTTGPTTHKPKTTQGWGARIGSELGGLFPGARYQYAKQRLDWVWAAPLNGSIALNVALGGGAWEGWVGADREACCL